MKKNYFMAVIALSACTGLFAIYYLYQNSKTDAFDRGSVEVNQCREGSSQWKIYKCTGNYTSGVGMMSKDNVTVTVTGDELHKGDIIYDVYPPIFHSKMNTDYFVTGKERSSVLYNSPWLLLLYVSLFIPIGAVFYTLGRRRKNNTVSVKSS